MRQSDSTGALRPSSSGRPGSGPRSAAQRAEAAARRSLAENEARCHEFLRAVPLEALLAAEPEFWRHAKENAEEPAAAAAKGKPAAAAAAKKVSTIDSEDAPKLEALPDTEGGGLFLSHGWAAPEDWSEHFDMPFIKAKQMQVVEALSRNKQTRRVALREAAATGRVWIDVKSLPEPINDEDHPLDKVSFGPFAMTVKALKELLALGSSNAALSSTSGSTPEPILAGSAGYTTLKLPDGYPFQGTMQRRRFDEKGRALAGANETVVDYAIEPGWYHVRAAIVIPNDKISPEEAASKEPFRPRVMQLRRWCQMLRLRDEVWVEVELGTLRAEHQILAEAALATHAGFVACMTWSHFDRLWLLAEWAVYHARRGPDNVQIGAEFFLSRARSEYHRALRRVSVNAAECRDPRDRQLLLELLQSVFSCGVHAKKSFAKPMDNAWRQTQQDRVVDYSAVERYVQATAIAHLARETARTSNRELGVPDEGGWAALAEELGLVDAYKSVGESVYTAIKKCKPYDWLEASALEAGHSKENFGQLRRNRPQDYQEAAKFELKGAVDDENGQALEQADIIEAAYMRRMDEWWKTKVLPVLEEERKRAAR